MDKRPSFENELEAIAYDVETSLKGMVEVLSSKTSSNLKQSKQQREEPMTEIEDQSNEAIALEITKGSRRRLIKKSIAPESVVLVNVTTRLSRETNELLTEASLRQRLKRVKPNTRQEVIEVALKEWCERNGYR